MSTIRKLRDSFQVDFYLGNYRFRKNLSTEEEARHLVLIIESKILGKESLVEDAVNLYMKSVSSLKSKKSQAIDKSILERLQKTMRAVSGGESMFISSVKPHRIEEMRTAMIAEGIANTSINRYFNTLKHFFKKCEEWGFLHKSPAKFIRSLPNDSKRRRTWTLSEIAVVRNLMPEPKRTIFDLLTLTGARLSQILNLKVEDVEPHNMLIQLRSKKGPKAQEKTYQVPISKQALEILMSAIGEKSHGDFIFSEKGQPLCPMLFSKNFQRLLMRHKLNYQHLTLHGLRHTFASQLSLRGAPINDIRLLLGHSTSKVTEGYIHSHVENLRKYFI